MKNAAIRFAGSGQATAMLFGALLALLTPLPAAAQPAFTMDVCWLGFACQDFNVSGINLTNTLFGAVGLICVTIFIVGAAFMVFSAGNDTLLQKGKGMMTGALITLVIVVGSYAIWRTVVFILYAGP